MGRAVVFVEGHGEVEAVPNLLSRLSHELHFWLPWTPARRWKNLHLWTARGATGVLGAVEKARREGAAALLILHDLEDDCPATYAPTIAARLQELRLPFPVAYVLMYPEYEVLFLPCLAEMADLGFGSSRWDGETWESRRGIKEWLSHALPSQQAYKPRNLQLPMTQRLNFDTLREADVPCFGSLERAIMFLRDHQGVTGAAYPPQDPTEREAEGAKGKKRSKGKGRSGRSGGGE